MLYWCRNIKFFFAFLLSFIVLCTTSAAEDFNSTDITTAQKRAEKMIERIRTNNKYMSEMEKQAKKSKEYFKSKEYQAKIEAYKKRILGLRQFGNVTSQYTPKSSSRIKGCAASLNEHERLYIFISSSMPTATIRRYIQDVDKLQDPNIHILLRGFVGGVKYLKPTIEFFVKCVKKDPLCEGSQCELYNVGFDVDPLPFRKYRIDRVPAVVYVPYEQKITPENIAKPNEYYKVSGDAKLEYVLNLIYEKSKASSVKLLAEKLKTGFYNQKRRDQQ